MEPADREWDGAGRAGDICSIVSCLMPGDGFAGLIKAAFGLRNFVSQNSM
jgi:hypothetical protein